MPHFYIIMNMRNTNNRIAYLAPHFEIISIQVESNFMADSLTYSATFGFGETGVDETGGEI